MHTYVLFEGEAEVVGRMWRIPEEVNYSAITLESLNANFEFDTSILSHENCAIKSFYAQLIIQEIERESRRSTMTSIIFIIYYESFQLVSAAIENSILFEYVTT